MSSDTPPRAPWQPKLRSSCDGCGIAKVKRDRNQPECGRCVSHGMSCVYGISRKMGKPPRNRHYTGGSRSASAARVGSGFDADVDVDVNHRHINARKGGNVGAGGVVDDLELALASFPNHTNTTPTAWNSIGNHNSTQFMVSLDTVDGMYTDVSHPMLPSAFNSLHLGEQDNDMIHHQQMGHFSTPESPYLGNYSPSRPPTAMPPPSSPTDYMSSVFGGEDCPQEAHEILASLSSLNLSKAYYGELGTDGAAIRVPLDQILRVNREASERLGSILANSCVRYPHVAMVYATIISRILLWYQRAAVCTRRPSLWSTTSVTSSLSRSNSMVTSNPASPEASRFAVAPAAMAIGTFNVDDPNLQTALQMQLLSGEMGRVGYLIDQFTRHFTGGQYSLDDPTLVGGINVDGLYHFLSSWLRTEHSRIACLLRSDFKDFDA